MACAFDAGQSSAQQTTAFTYQGQLHDGGTNANGTYTMIFKLYDALNSGNQIGSGITNNPTLANGLFTVNLDFGVGAFNGSARWLDISITNGGTTQTLSPRVQVLPLPYAQFAAVAATVTDGGIMNAQLAGNAVNATNIASGQVVKSVNGLTDFVTLARGNNVSLFTNGGVLQISATVSSVELFGSSGIFVVPTNVTKITVEVWGGGGGGGSGYGSSYTNNAGGGGGGAGGYAWNVFNVTSGASYTVTVGSGGSAGAAGGTSSFGALISAGGGSPGGNASGNAIVSIAGSGGLPGVTTGNLIPVRAGVGQSGFYNLLIGGNGGSAFHGGNGGWGNQDQKDGETPGGGGGGGVYADQGGAGGNGAQGGVSVYY